MTGAELLEAAKKEKEEKRIQNNKELLMDQLHYFERCKIDLQKAEKALAETQRLHDAGEFIYNPNGRRRD